MEKFDNKSVGKLHTLIKEMLDEPDPKKAVPDHRKEIEKLLIAINLLLSSTINNFENLAKDHARLVRLVSTNDAEILSLKNTICKLAAQL